MIKLRFFIIIIFSFFSLMSFNQSVKLTSKRNSIPINHLIRFIEDTSKLLSIEDIISLYEEDKNTFYSKSNQQAFFKTKDVAYWGHFKIKNQQLKSTNQLLHVNSNYINNIHVYATKNKINELIGISGNRNDINDHQIKSRTKAFEFIIPAQDSVELLFCFFQKRKNGVTFTLYDTKTYLEFESKNNLIIGVFLGGFIIIFIYASVIYFFNRKKIFLIYAVYILCTLFLASYIYGVDYVYFTNFLGEYYGYTYLLTFVWVMALIHLSRSFLEIRTYNKRLYKLSTQYIYFYYTMCFLCVIGYLIDNTFPFMVVSYITTSMTILLIFSMLLVVLKNNKVLAYYYIFAFTPALLGLIIFTLLEHNVIENDFLKNYVLLIGTFLEMLIISFGIANKLRLENKMRLSLSMQLAQQEKELFSKIEENNEKERANIAHTLHDNFGARVKQIRSYIDGDKLYKARESLEILGKDIRDISHAMSPTILDHLSLFDAVQDYTVGVGDESAQFHLFNNNPNEILLDKRTKTVVYNIILELIGNALKHGEAKNIALQFNTLNNVLSITVEDDGKGFDTSHQTTGIGLQSIQSRIHSLEGAFSIKSNPSQGTFCLLEIPI